MERINEKNLKNISGGFEKATSPEARYLFTYEEEIALYEVGLSEEENGKKAVVDFLKSKGFKEYRTYDLSYIDDRKEFLALMEKKKKKKV